MLLFNSVCCQPSSATVCKCSCSTCVVRAREATQTGLEFRILQASRIWGLATLQAVFLPSPRSELLHLYRAAEERLLFCFVIVSPLRPIWPRTLCSWSDPDSSHSEPHLPQVLGLKAGGMVTGREGSFPHSATPSHVLHVKVLTLPQATLSLISLYVHYFMNLISFCPKKGMEHSILFNQSCFLGVLNATDW